MKIEGVNLKGTVCPRCGDKLVIARYQSDVKSQKIVGYCFNPKHVYSPVKVMTVDKIRLSLESDVDKSLDEKYNMRNILCLLCGNKIYFDKKASYQVGGKIVGNCYKEGHRVEIVYVAKVVDEPDCKEIIEVKIKRSKY